jgi:hypothetical protein
VSCSPGPSRRADGGVSGVPGASRPRDRRVGRGRARSRPRPGGPMARLRPARPGSGARVRSRRRVRERHGRANCGVAYVRLRIFLRQ